MAGMSGVLLDQVDKYAAQVRPLGPLRQLQRAIEATAGERLVYRCFRAGDRLEPKSPQLLGGVLGSRGPLPVGVLGHRCPHGRVVAAVQLVGEVVVLDKGKVLHQPPECQAGWPEGTVHRVSVQAAGLPGEGAAVSMERAKESLDLVRCGGKGARAQFVEVAHADEYRSAGLKHGTNMTGAVAPMSGASLTMSSSVAASDYDRSRNARSHLRTTPMIEAKALTKHYGQKLAVDQLSFTVRAGVVTGFLGPNGSGKSTTMRIIMGLDAPDAGDVTVNGRHYHDLPWPLHEVDALLEARSIHPGRSHRAFSDR